MRPERVAQAERLREAIEKANWPHREVTVSLGVAKFEPGADSARLISMADQALYEAKRLGRNGRNLYVEAEVIPALAVYEANEESQACLSRAA